MNQKQNALQAGSGITLSGNTISFDGTLYFTAAQIAVLFIAYTSTAGLNTILAAYANTASLNTLLAAYTNTVG